MRIQVINGYFVGFGRWIAPGEYTDGDAGLFGMEAGYLASNGHAVVLPDIEPEPIDISEPEPEESKPAPSRKRGK